MYNRLVIVANFKCSFFGNLHYAKTTYNMVMRRMLGQ